MLTDAGLFLPMNDKQRIQVVIWFAFRLLWFIYYLCQKDYNKVVALIGEAENYANKLADEADK